LLGKKVIIFAGVTLISAAQPMGCFAGNNGDVTESIRGTRDRIEGNFRNGRQVKWQVSK
jgi:hypothetical protein